MKGKIAHLPRPLREEVNRRLFDDQPHEVILEWLNCLPEVKALLGAHFEGQPVSKQNLYEWTQYGYRDWKLRQDALEFAALTDPSDSPASDAPVPSTSELTDKLLHWLALRYAAAAHTLAPLENDAEADLRRLRDLAADIFALRRGDLWTRRLDLEQRRVHLLESDAGQALEEEFWEWTEREDIRAELEERRKKRKAWHDEIRATMPEVAPYLPPEDPEDAEDPTAAGSEETS